MGLTNQRDRSNRAVKRQRKSKGTSRASVEPVIAASRGFTESFDLSTFQKDPWTPSQSHRALVHTLHTRLRGLRGIRGGGIVLGSGRRGGGGARSGI